MKKFICIFLTMICILISGCTDEKKNLEKENLSESSSEEKRKEPEKEPSSSKSKNEKDIGDMTLNEIANAIEEIPPEAMDELTSKMEEEWMKEMESASYKEWNFYDPNKTDTSSIEWSWDNDPAEDDSENE